MASRKGCCPNDKNDLTSAERAFANLQFNQELEPTKEKGDNTMPNWCQNRLFVTGARHRVRKFQKLVKTDKSALSFATTVPVDDGDGDEWYARRLIAWGTKWDVGEDDVHADDGAYEFATAWGPPDTWLARTAGLFPDLHFQLIYEEPGIGFMGVVDIKEDYVRDYHINYGIDSVTNLIWDGRLDNYIQRREHLHRTQLEICYAIRNQYRAK
jgi:hypothetical protein